MLDALGYLQSIYRNPMEPTSVRISAAVECFPFKDQQLIERLKETWTSALPPDFMRRIAIKGLLATLSCRQAALQTSMT
jgi:hypothetical protein